MATDHSPAPSPELLYLLSGDEEDFQAATADLLPPDLAEALNELPVEAAARIVSALPFHRTVQLFDEPELDRRGELFEQLEESVAVPVLEAMSADQQVELFRELPDTAVQRLIHVLDEPTRNTLRLLLRFPPTTAGGIMTTEFVSVPASWTADRVRQHILEVGSGKETVYAIYVLDPVSQQLLHVVSLREILLAEPNTPVSRIGTVRAPVSVRPLTDREDVARIISKYNLLAIPVVDGAQRVLGVVTVDDVIDAMVRETTEDVQKLG
ncbi:MAG TPA: CBS domain-containing protein, partial [Gemmatimonadales bacterium]|nr:CBS domain-containing protein [Gemmatimonadales bacterium]